MPFSILLPIAFGSGNYVDVAMSLWIRQKKTEIEIGTKIKEKDRHCETKGLIKIVDTIDKIRLGRLWNARQKEKDRQKKMDRLGEKLTLM